MKLSKKLTILGAVILTGIPIYMGHQNLEYKKLLNEQSERIKVLENIANKPAYITKLQDDKNIRIPNGIEYKRKGIDGKLILDKDGYVVENNEFALNLIAELAWKYAKATTDKNIPKPKSGKEWESNLTDRFFSWIPEEIRRDYVRGVPTTSPESYDPNFISTTEVCMAAERFQKRFGNKK